MTAKKSNSYSINNVFLTIALAMVFCVIYVFFWNVKVIEKRAVLGQLNKIANNLYHNLESFDQVSKNGDSIYNFSSDEFVSSKVQLIKEVRALERVQYLLNLLDSNLFYLIVSLEDSKIISGTPNLSNAVSENIFRYIENYQSDSVKDDSYIDKNEIFYIKKISEVSPIFLILGTELTKYDFFAVFGNNKLQFIILTVVMSGFIYLFYRSILIPFLSFSKIVCAISEGSLEFEGPYAVHKEGNLIKFALEKIILVILEGKKLIEEMSQTRSALSLNNLKLENKVAERTKELNDIIKEKNIFIKNLSYEIKTPLVSVNNILRNLTNRWKKIGDNEKFDLAYQASYSTQSLISLTENLSEISRFSNGKAVLDLKSSNIIELIREVILETNLLLLSHKKIEISFDKDRKDIFVTMDKNRMRQVLRNLISNAVKFSNSSGYISINIEYTQLSTSGFQEDAVLFSLTDHGIGISQEEALKMFLPFQQNTTLAITKDEGMSAGLGLSICSDIIRAHRGKIWAENNKDGGATFSFIIPLLQSNDINIVENSNLSDYLYNIVVIDDEEVCLNSMEMLLRGTKFNLIKINSAEFAVDYLRRNAQYISVIFVDLMMPDVYGINLITALKEDKFLKEVPIILQTSSSDEKEISKAFERGIFSFISKPYQKGKLLEEINLAIEFKKNINRPLA